MTDLTPGPECGDRERAMFRHDPVWHRVDMARREIPYTVQRLTQFVVDNPAQVALLAAGTVVVCTAAHNIVKPKSLLEVVALSVVLEAATPYACQFVLRKGWLTFRVRDADGALVTVPAPPKEL